MTKLLYLEDFDVTNCEATVTKVEEFEGKQVIVLDQTCFYPKGGGQDYDLGNIKSKNADFKIEAVIFVDGEVKHIGEFENDNFTIGDKVSCSVEIERRELNSRIHSAGHALDMAVRKLGWSWHPGKGAHYPHMSFVEYSGEFDSEQKQKLIEELQLAINELLAKGTTNTIKFMTPEEMSATGAVVPENLPKGKPTRAVFYDDFAVPCGGTHVKNINQVGKIIVTNMKRKNGNIRVSYQVA